MSLESVGQILGPRSLRRFLPLLPAPRKSFGGFPSARVSLRGAMLPRCDSFGPRQRSPAALTPRRFPPLARANGRFPLPVKFPPDPGDPNHLVLRATFGVLESTDAGKTWGWICENVIGYVGVEDPALAVTADGTILAGIFEGLSVSHDRGCSWAFAAGPTDTQYTIDTAVERGDPSHSVAVTATGVAGGFHVVLAQSLDNGATWTQAGTAAPSDFIAQTVDVAPSIPMRAHLSGIVEQGTAVMAADRDE